jgi:TrmH family RNA methyltransferase
MKITNTQLKYIKSLHQPKFRQMYENFIAEGDKLVSHLLLSEKFEIELLVANAHWIEAHQYLLKRFQNKVFEVDSHQMQQITGLKTASDVLLVIKKSKISFNESLIKNGLSFYLDGVQDPGNVGTIIRIADWFGFKSVLRSEDSADFYSPKVVQASMGSISNVHLFTLTRGDFSHLKIPIFITDMRGKSIKDLGIVNYGIVVLGREGSGVSDELLAIDNKEIISIPK